MYKWLSFNRVRQLYKKDIVKNILILFSGNTLAQVIPLLLTPILTRIFSKDDFGVLFLFNSVIIILSVLSTLKYELSVVLPKNQITAKYLVVTGLFVSFIVSILLMLVLLLVGSEITIFFDKDQSLGFWLYLVPLCILLTGIIQTCNYWLNRERNFKSISIGKVYKSVSTGGVQLATGYNFLNINGLIFGVIFGQVVNAIYFLKKTFSDFKNFPLNYTFKRMFKIAAHYRDIPLFNTLIGFLNTLSNHLPIFMLTRFYGIEAAGLYGMSLRIVGIPMGLISQAISEVFYSSASKKYNTNKSEFYSFIRLSLKRLLLFAIVPFTLLALFSPFIFKIFLGELWIESGIYTQIMIPWLFLMFINSPLTSIITIIRKQKYLVLYDIMLLLARFLGLLIGFKVWNNVLYSIALFALSGFVFNLILLIFLYKYPGKKNASYNRNE